MKHVAFKASSRLRAAGIRLDENLTLTQMQGRRALSFDFLRLKSRGYKPFFRGVTLKYRDGAVVRKCAHGEANKVVADAARAAQTAAPTPARPPQRQRPEHNSVAFFVFLFFLGYRGVGHPLPHGKGTERTWFGRCPLFAS